jgi:nicotinamide-nucleotide amidase
MRAHVLSIGDELLGGYITDTNSTFLGQQLALLNIDLNLVTHVGDNRDRIAEVIARGRDEADIVICTGGIGPTGDDLTREAIAQVLGETPEVDHGLLELIKAFFAGRGLEMPARNAKQAWLIPSAQPLPNPVGTAPGWYIHDEDGVIAAMPGVPREMVRMWTDQLQPRLAALRSDTVIRSATLKTIGIGESLVEQHLHALVQQADPVVATYAKDDGVHIRITAIGADVVSAETKREACVNEIRDLIGGFIYGRDTDTLPGTLLGELRALDLTASITDSGGGGRFAALLASTPGASDNIIGSEMFFASSGQTTAHQARLILGSYETDIGIAINVTTEEDTPGVYAAKVDVAVTGARSSSRSFPVRSGWEDIQRRSALCAAEVLRSALISD